MDTLSLAILFPPAYFFFVTSITPGPNNIMLAASGMNFGYTRSLPHLLGIALGLGLLVVLCAIGVGALYEAYPTVRLTLRVLGAGYLLYLAYRIATADGAEVTGDGRPLHLHEALAFQFVNPKAWVMALTAVASFMPDFKSTMAEAIFMLVVAVSMNFPCTSSWVLFGKVIARIFTTKRTRKIVNFVMGALLVAIIPMLIS